MNARKQRIEAVFDAAIELTSPDQRSVYLSKSCGDEQQLRQEIEELLQAYEKAGGFLPATLSEGTGARAFGVPPSGGATGEPAKAGTPDEAIRAPTTIAKARGTDAPKLVHLIRDDLDWIVMKCLKKDRTRRYETANALAIDLKRHLSNEPIIARPPSKLYRFQKLVRRNKLAFAATTAVATEAEEKKKAQEAQASEASQRKIAVEQQKLAEEARKSETQQRQMAQAAHSLLANALAGAVISNHFSPVGTRLVSLSGPTTVIIWDTRTGKKLGQPLEHDSAVTAALFSQDGERVITVASEGTLISAPRAHRSGCEISTTGCPPFSGKLKRHTSN